jgi:hypothetical protein
MVVMIYEKLNSAAFHAICHIHGTIGRPGPGSVLPLQGRLHLRLRGIARQRCSAAALGHLQHQGRQLAARRQPLHRCTLQTLVVGRIVLLAQQHVGGGLGMQRRRPRR